MHNHDGGQGHDSKMMWLMMLPCLLVPAAFLVISGRGFGSVADSWQWIIAIAAMIGIHIFMMKSMHGHEEDASSVQDEKKL